MSGCRRIRAVGRSGFGYARGLGPRVDASVQKVTNDPWTGALDRKTVELICVAINTACTTSMRMVRENISA